LPGSAAEQRSWIIYISVLKSLAITNINTLFKGIEIEEPLLQRLKIFPLPVIAVDIEF
jgi:hypothetical protein